MSIEREILKLGVIETNEHFTEKLGSILRLLGIASKELRDITADAIAAEADYKRIHARAMLDAALNKELSNAELRKAHAELRSLEAWELMQVAKFRRENCVEWIDTLKKALLAVQSVGANVRAEMQMSGIGEMNNGNQRKAIR